MAFGWGTNLTNDFEDCAPTATPGLTAISLVCKVTSANGRPAVKLSDNPAKATGDPKEIARYIKAVRRDRPGPARRQGVSGAGDARAIDGLCTMPAADRPCGCAMRAMRRCRLAAALLLGGKRRSLRPCLRSRLCAAPADRALHRRRRDRRRRELPCAHPAAAGLARPPRLGAACRCSAWPTARGRSSAFFPSCCSLALVAAGFLGSRDPLSNPLPLTVWTLLWVGLTLVQGIFGNLWAWINPWYGPYWLARRLGLPSPLLRLPRAARLLAGRHSVCRLRMVRTDRSGARRSGAACRDRGRLCRGQSRGDADLRLPRLEPARRVPVGVLRHDLGLRHLADERSTGRRRARTISLGLPGAALARRQPAAAERRVVPAAGAVVGVVRRPVAHLPLARAERRQPARISRPLGDDRRSIRLGLCAAFVALAAVFLPGGR